ncbi:hypothetical protein ACFTXM_14285 [Streptomyces sp. NPDC056930]|uniref:hypothetical protein n=1 Tax=Streptomyces sp. NPDC056930 TaxID=3345967 RepID=UPI00363CDE0D
MGVRRLWDHFLEHPAGGGLVAVPFALIVTITALDIYTGRDIQLGPLLVIAPALTASLAGPRLTALAGVLAVVAQVLIAVFLGELTTTNRVAQIIALAALSALMFFMRFVRERRDRALSRARSVAETAQRVLLRPPPRRIGPLQVAWLYMSAEDETEIGGDLFAFARAAHAATRVVIGDVRGNGLAAIGEASLVLGAFREGAHRYATLPGLVAALGDSVTTTAVEAAMPRASETERRAAIERQLHQDVTARGGRRRTSGSSTPCPAGRRQGPRRSRGRAAGRRRSGCAGGPGRAVRTPPGIHRPRPEAGARRRGRRRPGAGP